MDASNTEPGSRDTEAREAHAFAIGLQACIVGLPLVESMRTASQMTAVDAPQDTGRAPLNQFGHAARPWTHLDRDVVTPANDLLYSMGWLDLAAEPIVLTVPPEAKRYWVMALLDAWTNNFLNIGPRMTQGRAAQFAITTPGWQGVLPEGVQRVNAPTPLVWILGRTLVDDAADLSAARAVQTLFTLTPLSAFAPSNARQPVKPLHYDRYQASDDPLGFFDNLARGLAENPPPLADEGLIASFSGAGIRPGMPVRTDLLDEATIRGLQRGYQAAMNLIESRTRSRRKGAWGINDRLGRFGTDYLARAATAAKGMGGLAADEALYAMADYDSSREALHGSRNYVLHFDAGQLPPCDAFWSVSLYGEDRFFVANPIDRHALGDRSRGLSFNADGSLDILIQHERPGQRVSNWLPAPAGPFYLILRLYHPRTEALQAGYRIPPIECVPPAQPSA